MMHVRVLSPSRVQQSTDLNDVADMLMEQRDLDADPKVWDGRTRRDCFQEAQDPTRPDDAAADEGLFLAIRFLQPLTLSIKLERADDLGLPPRTVVVRRDYFSPEEKELYLSLFSDAKRQFNTYVDAGTILNSTSRRRRCTQPNA